MDLQHVRMFVTVAEVGSIHAASRTMFLSQPSLSNVLHKLEREIGKQLLIRSPRGVELTEAGRVFLDRSRLLLADFDQALSDTRAGRARRPFRIGLLAGHYSAAELTNYIVAMFRRSQPDLVVSCVELNFQEHATAVQDRRVDVVIARPPYDDPLLEVIPLFSEPRVLCVSSEHPVSRSGVSDKVKEALKYPRLRISHAPEPWGDYWGLAALRDAPVEEVEAPAVTVSELLLSLVGTSATISVTASCWRMGLASPFLRAIPVPEAEPNTVVVGFRKGNLTDDVQAFIRVAQQAAEERIGMVPQAVLAT